MIISGSSHPHLAQSLAEVLGDEYADVDISTFPNGEKRIWVKSPLGQKTIIIVQSFSTPVDEHIVEFCLLADSAKQGNAKKIIGVIPWFGYSPQDKLFRPGEPISAHVVAQIISSIGLDHIFIVDIHSQTVLQRFNHPAIETSALSLFVDHFKNTNLTNYIAVAPDQGATIRAQKFARQLNLPLVQMEKSRHRSTGEVDFKPLDHNIKGKHAISFDDFLSTGSTSIKASQMLKANGALSYTICVTHCLLTGDSPQNLQSSGIDKIITTNSYPIPKHKMFPKLTILPIAHLLAKSLKPLLQ